MFKAISNWFGSHYGPMEIVTTEEVKVVLVESTRVDMAELTITVTGSKDVVKSLEKILKNECYKMLATNSVRDKQVIALHSAPFRGPMNNGGVLGSN